MDLTVLFVTTLLIHSNLFFALDTSNPSIIPTQVWDLYYSSMRLKTPAFEEARNFKEFNPQLVNSWKSAKKAQKISSELKDSVLSYYIYLFSPKEANKFLPFYNKFNKAEAYYRASINNASEVFSMLRNRFASDMQLLDLVGVDKSNSTARAHFEEGKRVLEAFRGGIASSCSSFRLPVKASCALEMMKNKKTAPEFYSAVVSASNNSLLVLFSNFHSKTQRIVKKMNNQYTEENKQTEKLLKNVSLLLKWFDNQQAYLITSKYEKKFYKGSKQQVMLGKPSHFPMLASESREKIEEQSNSLIEAKRIFETRADDYLLDSIIKTEEVKRALESKQRELEEMKNKLMAIEGNAKQEAIAKRQGAEESYFTNKADYFIKKAETLPIGLAVVYYSEAIEYLDAVGDERTLEKFADKARAIAIQLKKLGVNVEREEEEIKLFDKTSPSNIEQMIAKADIILTQLKMKALPFMEEEKKERKRIRSLFDAAKELSSLPFFKRSDNNAEQKFEASLLDDDFETLYSDLALYAEIERELEKEVYPFVNTLLENKTKQELSISKADCNEEVSAIDKVTIANPFDVLLKNITLSVKPLGRADLQVKGRVFFKIKELEPRSRKKFFLNVTLTPAHCYAQHDNKEGNRIISSRNVEVLFPLKEVLVPFEKPFEQAEVLKASHYFVEGEGKVVLELPAANTTAFVVFSTPSSNLTSNSSNAMDFNETQEELNGEKFYYNTNEYREEGREEAKSNEEHSSRTINDMTSTTLSSVSEQTASERELLMDDYNSSVSIIREKAKQELEFAKNHYTSEEMLSKAISSFEKGEYINSIYYSRKATERQKSTAVYALLLFFIGFSFMVFFMLKKPKKKKQPRRVIGYHFSR